MLNTFLRAAARCVLACTAATAACWAADFTPTGAAGDWNDPGNWSTAAIPTLADDVTIGAGLTARLDDPAVMIEARSITIASGGTLDLSLGAGDTQANLVVDTDLTVNGELLAGGDVSGVGALITCNDAAPTISGSGQITFGANTASFPVNGVSLQNGATLSLGGSIRLTGSAWQVTQTDIADGGGVPSAVISVGATATVEVPASGLLKLLNGTRMINNGTLALRQGAQIQFDFSNVNSSFEQTASGELDWELNGSGSAALMAPGSVQLAGTLNGTRPADVFLGVGETAYLITGSFVTTTSITGDFTTTTGMSDFLAPTISSEYSFNFNLERQVIDFDALPVSAGVGTSLTLNASTNVGQTVTFTVTLTSGGASNSSITGNLLTLSATPESIRVTARAAAITDSGVDYDAAEPVVQDIAVRAPATISITASLSGPFTYGDTIALTATDDSGGGAQTWSTTTPALVSITGTTARLIGIGTGASVTVEVAATGTTAAATTSATLGAINPAPVTATIDGGTRPTGQGNPTPTFTVTGLVDGDEDGNADADDVSVLGTPVFTGPGVDADNFTIAGSYAVTATFPSASANYTVTVIPGNLVITEAALTPTITITSDLTGPFTYGQVITLVANSPDSTGTITWTTSTPSQIAISGSTATVIGVGSGASVTANIAAAAPYIAGTLDATLGNIVAQPLIVTVDGGTRVYGLSANPTPSVTITGLVNGDTEADLGTRTFSGAGTTANATTGVGSYAVDVAYAPANPNYTFTPTSGNLVITKAPQVITFPTIASFAIGASRTLTATSDSGLTITYVSSAPTVASVTGSTLTGVAAGSATITASQAGDSNYDPAVDVTRTATVTTAGSGGDAPPTASPADGGCGAGGGIAVLLGTLSLFWRRRR